MSMKSQPPTPKQPTSLAKQATILAVLLGISGGICATDRGEVGFVIFAAGVTAAVCLLGLLCVAILMIVRSFSVKSRR